MAEYAFVDFEGLQYYDEKLNAAVVHKSGTETIDGAKTFSGTVSSTAGSTVCNGSVTTQFGGKMGSNDGWRIAVGATANDSGFIELATIDNGNEPIYVRQYNSAGATATPLHSATLLDASGNTSFPGTISAAGLDAPLSIYKLNAPATENVVNGIPIGLYPLIDASRSCKTAFLPAANITVEYTVDGGTTWLDYGASDAQKQNLFAMTRAASVFLGKSTTESPQMTTDCKLRITFNRTGRYVRVNTLYLYLSDTGHTMCVDLENSTFANPDTFNAIRTGVRVGGYSGPNVISFEPKSFGQANANQSGQTYAFRLTFYCTAIGSNTTYHPNVADIRMYGDVAWNYDNQMMMSDHLYSWDYAKNATFPNGVTAVQFTGDLAGNASTATKAAQDSNGRSISTGYMWRGSYERIEGTSVAHKDLNSYQTAGFYNIKTANVDNCPSGIGIDAVLLVYPWDRNNYLTQELTESAASGDVRRWLRKLNGSNWSAWKQMAFTSSDITGNAATATKATQDASGNVITTTYATKSELADISSITTAQIDTLFA